MIWTLYDKIFLAIVLIYMIGSILVTLPFVLPFKLRKIQCTTCNGNGWIRVQFHRLESYNLHVGKIEHCPDCLGQGYTRDYL